jgi:ATP-binding cassette subfamily C protein
MSRESDPGAIRQAGLRPMFLRTVTDVGLFSLLINLLLLVIPLYLLQVYDRVLPSSSVETLVYLSVIAVAALGFLGFLDAIRAVYTQRVAAMVNDRLGARMFAASLGSGNAPSPLTDLASVCAFIRSRGVAVLFDLPFAPVFLGLLYLIHPVLFWVTLGGAALLATRRTKLGAAVVAAGSLCMRWSVYKAGQQSARDPKYTVKPQRERASRDGTKATTKPGEPVGPASRGT